MFVTVEVTKDVVLEAETKQVKNNRNIIDWSIDRLINIGENQSTAKSKNSVENPIWFWMQQCEIEYNGNRKRVGVKK